MFRFGRRRSRYAHTLSFGPRTRSFRNTERELVLFRTRIAVAALLVGLCFLVLAARFVWLQLIKHEDLHAQAENNRISVVPEPARRGLILDRNGIVIARNDPGYTLELATDEIEDLSATIQGLARVVSITERDERRFRKLLDDLRGSRYVPIRTRLSDEEVARFTAQSFRFPGVKLRAQLFRHYPMGEIGAHMLGYVGRVSPQDKERIATWPNADDYAGTLYIGKVGLEQSYEEALHGTTGYERVEITAGGRAVRSLSHTPSVPGNDLTLSVDIKLQALAERAFGDRRGALIAIEPATGDVLAFVSRPSYDPNLFVEGIDPENWDSLNTHEDKPMLNRALRGTYPIGSTYKPFMALAALSLGVRKPETVIHDPGYFIFGNRRFRDSNPTPLGPVNMHRSIVKSSDVYYYMLANDLGVDTIHDFMKPFGFGQLTGIDIEGEMHGILPSKAWKLKRFKQPWYPGETISIGIGQGYNSFTLLQLAHATAILANDGVVMKPHLVKQIKDSRSGQSSLTVPKESYRIDLKPEHLKVIREAMVDVNISGTGRWAFRDVPYRVGGKTGTAQVIGIKQNEKYDEKRIDERFRDHSLYIAFAPAGPDEKPTIALAVIVENAGFGATAAAPVARQIIDYV
ncbi:MAG TPA: penicillin-binding protein 2, partial [Burkholderiaceae bacterium]|nr:penicillin-binding protein 2 [Burkholderiaceae bacterium]